MPRGWSVACTRMRMSQLFLRTLRDDPADAEVDSHRLLVRAGYIRRVSAGVYAWLPLGPRGLRRIQAVVPGAKDSAPAPEGLVPLLQPPRLVAPRRPAPPPRPPLFP